MLMEAVIERGKTGAGVRLVHDAFNSTSLSLYSSLGFEVREPLSLMEGQLHNDVPPDVTVRALKEEDYAGCAELCRLIHGFDCRPSAIEPRIGDNCRSVARPLQLPTPAPSPRPSHSQCAQAQVLYSQEYRLQPCH